MEDEIQKNAVYPAEAALEKVEENHILRALVKKLTYSSNSLDN
ncbi:hypothetical protein [Paenibacillus pabuli]